MSLFICTSSFLNQTDYINFQEALIKLRDDKRDNKSETKLENEKEVYKLENLDDALKIPIKEIAGENGKNQIRKLTGWNGELFSLLEFDGFGGYAPLHIMKSNGYLGSHVDHTFIKKGELIHIGNSIYYANGDWQPEWGGETVFFNNSGFKEINRIQIQKNMLLSFTHDCESFHGVARIKCPNDVSRTTIYMDYYIKRDDLIKFQSEFFAHTGKKFIYSKFLTTFVPVAVENNRLVLSSVFNRQFFGYLKNYLKYLKQKNLSKPINGLKKSTFMDLAFAILINCLDIKKKLKN